MTLNMQIIICKKFPIFFLIIIVFQNCYLSKPVPVEERQRDESAFEAYSEAVILNEDSQYNEALEKINIAIKMNNKIAKFILLKAQILENSDRNLDAFAAYKKALKIQIYNPVVHEKMGELLAEIEQYHSAIQSVKKAFAQKPQDTRLLIIVASYYIELKSFDRADSYLNTYENQTPVSEFSGDYYSVRAIIYFQSGNYSETVDALDKCRLSKPLTTELHKLYLDALLNSEEYDDLYKHLTSLELKDLTRGDQHFYKGAYYFYTKNYSDALSQLDFALELKTQDSRVYYYLGKVHFELGNLSESKKMFDIFRNKTERPELEDVRLKDMEETEI